MEVLVQPRHKCVPAIVLTASTSLRRPRERDYTSILNQLCRRRTPGRHPGSAWQGPAIETKKARTIHSFRLFVFSGSDRSELSLPITDANRMIVKGRRHWCRQDCSFSTGKSRVAVLALRVVILLIRNGFRVPAPRSSRRDVCYPSLQIRQFAWVAADAAGRVTRNGLIPYPCERATGAV